MVAPTPEAAVELAEAEVAAIRYAVAAIGDDPAQLRQLLNHLCEKFLGMARAAAKTAQLNLDYAEQAREHIRQMRLVHGMMRTVELAHTPHDPDVPN
jgi:hypothetical protein